jgi:hypothetical protein
MKAITEGDPMDSFSLREDGAPLLNPIQGIQENQISLRT